jgi:hypothetical protein
MRLYTVGRTIAGRPAPVTIEAEDALAAALKAKEDAPDAVITYVRKQNKRGDRRHPHQGANAGDSG